jgi:Family of unknown function (DUF6326)
MSNISDQKNNPVQPLIYQIRLQGHLDREWTDWFEGLTITLEDNGDTLLTGPVIDQAALHGLLKKVRDLGLPLVSVSQAQFNESHPYRSKKEKEMNTNKSTTGIDPKVKLSLLWIFVVLLMIYADIVSLMDPTSAIRERMAGAPMSAGFLLAGAIVMIISIVMVILSWVLNYKVNRWVTIVIGAFMIVNIVTGGHGLYYVLFETVEVAFILLISWFTWKWKPAVAPDIS